MLTSNVIGSSCCAILLIEQQWPYQLTAQMKPPYIVQYFQQACVLSADLSTLSKLEYLQHHWSSLSKVE